MAPPPAAMRRPAQRTADSAARAVMHPLVLFASVAAVGALPPPLIDPPWDWTPSIGQYAEHCLRVPDTPGFLPNTMDGNWNGSIPRGRPTIWKNNSRLLHLAVPEGTPPPTGWPVVITVDIHPVGSFATPKTPCDGEQSVQALLPKRPKVPPVCATAIAVACSNATLRTNYSTCSSCILHRVNATTARSRPCKSSWHLIGEVCPRQRTPARCVAQLGVLCGGAYNRTNRTEWRGCQACVKTSYVNATACVHTPTAQSQRDITRAGAAVWQICGVAPRASPRTSHYLVPPWISPDKLARRCSCINGSTFSCSTPFDDGHAGHEYVPQGGFCDSIIFFGALYRQRLRQALLLNGIAVMTMATHITDGWCNYDAAWEQGYDAVAFDELNALLRHKNRVDAPSIYRTLDPDRVALRGWSGGSQMVSWMMEAVARRTARNGPTSMIGLRAGVMMSGGSYACYNSQPEAIGSCANCSSGASAWKVNKSIALGCSNPAACKARGLAQPYCEYCCPMNYTEQWYAENASRYATHPHTLFGQTTLDIMADSCASTNYHNTMIAHGAVSKRIAIPPAHERCYALGVPGDNASVPRQARKYSRFCSNPNMSSLGHTQGFPEFVEPALLFLLNAFGMNITGGTNK